MGLGNRMSDSYFKQNICFKNLTRVRCLTHAQAAAILTGADLMDPVSTLSEAVSQGLYHEWSVTCVTSKSPRCRDSSQQSVIKHIRDQSHDRNTSSKYLSSLSLLLLGIMNDSRDGHDRGAGLCTEQCKGWMNVVII